MSGLIATITATGFISDHIPVRNLALADTRKVVSITADGENHIVTTDAATVGDVLHRAGIKVNQNDLVEPGEQTPLPSGFFNVNVYRSQLYHVVDGNKSSIVRSAQQAPRLIAADGSITVYPEDRLSIEMVRDFVDDQVVGQRLVIDRATPVLVTVDGTTKLLRSHAATVASLLSEKGVSLGEKDTASPALTHPLTGGMQITITRVSEVVATKDEILPRATKTVEDPTQPKGVTSVQTDGSDGKRSITYRIHYRDGVEIAREILKVASQLAPVDKVVTVGTKIQFAGSIEHWRPYVIEAAAKYGVDPNLMLAIMTCESGGNASASNGSHFGLYQYSRDTWKSYGNSLDTIFDGPTQIMATAGRLSQPNPTSPWLASKSCWVNSY